MIGRNRGGGAAQRLSRRGPAAYRSGPRRRTRDRQDHAVGGRDRRRPRARRRGARGACGRGRGPALLRRADRARRRARSRAAPGAAAGGAGDRAAAPRARARGRAAAAARDRARPAQRAGGRGADVGGGRRPRSGSTPPRPRRWPSRRGVCTTRGSASCSPGGPARATVLERALERGALERVHVGPLERARDAPVAEGAARARGGAGRGAADRRRDAGQPAVRARDRPAVGGGRGGRGPAGGRPRSRTCSARAWSQAPRAARRLLLAVALGSDLSADELEAIAPVDVALDAGLLIADGERVRAAHPLLAAAARAGAPAAPSVVSCTASWPSSPASPSSGGTAPRAGDGRPG